MQNWVINPQGGLLPSWEEALHGIRLATPESLRVKSEAGDEAIVWCRLRPEDSVHSVMGALVPRVHYPIVLLCDVPSENIVVEALTAGAVGCCNTYAAPEVLQQVAMVVSNGGLWIGRSLLQKLVGVMAVRLEGNRSGNGSQDWQGKLSEREIQVALHVAGGASNREVADKMGITERTVKAHLSSIFEKLGLRDRLQLTLKVNGLAI